MIGLNFVITLLQLKNQLNFNVDSFYFHNTSYDYISNSIDQAT